MRLTLLPSPFPASPFSRMPTMTELQQVTRVHELAEEIRNLVRMTVEGAVEIGYRLIEARTILKKERRWVAWLEDEFDWSVGMAYNLIRAAEAVKKEPKLLTLRSPSLLYLLSVAPDEVLDSLMDLDVGYAEAKLVVDAHKWAKKTRTMIAALQAVDMAETRARGDARTIALAEATADRILAELEAAMKNGRRHDRNPLKRLERKTGFEPATSTLARR